MQQNNRKIFGLGLSKTGTSSLCEALNYLGIKTIHYPFDQTTFEELQSGNYKLSLMQKYQGVVDIPVVPYYAQLDKAFPGSKFILTVREMESWLRSIDKHWELMLKWWNNYPEFKRFQEFIGAAVYGTVSFNADRFRFVYETHEKNVREYFKGRPQNFLVLDICGGEGWERLCAFLEVEVPAVPFPRANEWMHRLMEATAQIKGIIPAGDTFILIDQEGFGEEFSAGRRRLPFKEQNNRYDGLPLNSEDAIREFERLVHQQPKYLVFGWPSFWWFDYYKEFHDYLNERFLCVEANDNLVVYALKEKGNV